MSYKTPLIPRDTLDAQAKLHAFINAAQIKGAFGLGTQAFDNDAWNASGLLAKGINGYIYFARQGYNAKKYQHNGKRNAASIPAEFLLREPFRSFAKAMLIHLHETQPSTGIHARLLALRAVEAALYELDGCTCPTQVAPVVLDRACEILEKNSGRTLVATKGKTLNSMYDAMVELELLAAPDHWICPLKFKGTANNRVGKEFDEARQKKLPDPAALEALAEIFCRDDEDNRATFVSSCGALMLCDPDRSVEMLFAPANLLATDWKDQETGEVGTVLRWFPAKGAVSMTKTVIPSMRDVAVRAVDRLVRLSEPARTLARWYEQHPTRLYLPPELEHLRARERVTLNEICAILYGFAGRPTWGYKDAAYIRTKKFLRKHAIHLVDGTRWRPATAAFTDIERAILSLLPDGFPVMDPKTGMRYSEALCVMRTFEYAEWTSGFMPSMFGRVTYSMLANALNGDGTNSSIFRKRGYKNASGAFLAITSHQMRHYLNTLVRQGGRLTEQEIAHWSGRYDARQNSAYDHESTNDRIAKLQLAVGDPALAIGPFSNIDNRVFVRRDQFAQIKIITAYTTELGYCIHDYAQSPCQVHMDCINCNEMVCVKGDQQAEAHLRSAQVEFTRISVKAQKDCSAEVLGAAEWYQEHTKTLERINQLITILDDTQVPDGSVIQLSGVVPPSRLAMAKAARVIPIKPVGASIQSMTDARALLSASGPERNANAA